MKNKKSKSRIDNAAAMIKNSYQMHRGMISIQGEYTRDLNEILEKFENKNSVPFKNTTSSNSTGISIVAEDPKINRGPKKGKTKRYKELDKKRKKIPEKELHPGWAKELYRKIMRKCHPDILQNSNISATEKQYRSEVVLQVVEAMENKDYKEVLFLGVTVESYTEKLGHATQVQMLNSMFSDLVGKIDMIQKSVSWLWGINWDNLENRVHIIQSVIASKGFRLPSRQEIIAKIVEHELD